MDIQAKIDELGRGRNQGWPQISAQWSILILRKEMQRQHFVDTLHMYSGNVYFKKCTYIVEIWKNEEIHL